MWRYFRILTSLSYYSGEKGPHGPEFGSPFEQALPPNGSLTLYARYQSRVNPAFFDITMQPFSGTIGDPGAARTIRIPVWIAGDN